MGFPNMNKATSSVSIPEREKINSLIHSLCIVILQIVRGMAMIFKVEPFKIASLGHIH